MNEDTKITNVVLWLRVSSGDQDYKRQRNQLLNTIDEINRQNEANKNNHIWEKVEEFSEKKSGYSDVKRDEFEDFKEYLENNKYSIDKVLVTEISRIARSATKIEEFILFCKSLDISVYIDTKPKPIETLEKDLSTLESLPNKLILTMLAQFAQLEAELIGERSVGGKLKKFENGIPLHFGKIPFGYNLINKELAVNNEEAEIVKEIFELGVDNGARYITEYLNANDMLYRNGKEWNQSTIKNILNNKIYTGLQEYKFEVNKLKNKGKKKEEKEYKTYTNYLDVIIEEEQFIKVQKAKKSRKNLHDKDKRHTDKYLFLTKLYCGCGKRYKSTLYETNQGIIKDAHYSCLGKKTKYKCTSRNIPVNIFDEAFWKTFCLSTNLFKKIAQEKEEDFKLQDKRNEIKMYQAKIEDIGAEMKNTEHVFRRRGKRANWDEFDSEMAKYEAKIRDEERRIRNLKHTIKQFEKRKQLTEGEYINNIIGEQNFAKRREYIDKYVDRVVIHTCNKELSTFKPINKMWKNESLFYIQIFVLGSENPLCFACTNKTDNFKIAFNELNKFDFEQRGEENILIEKF